MIPSWLKSFENNKKFLLTRLNPKKILLITLREKSETEKIIKNTISLEEINCIEKNKNYQFVVIAMGYVKNCQFNVISVKWYHAKWQKCTSKHQIIIT